MNRLVDADSGATVYPRVILSDRFFSRLVGLLGRRALPADEAMVIRPCTGIHTCFMRFEIDVAFCDASGKVLATTTCLRPWRFAKGPKGTRFVVESLAGAMRLRPSQRICITGEAD